MSDNSERSSSATRLAVPSLIVLVLATYSYLTYRAPLETSRPRDTSLPHLRPPPSPQGLEVVWARMWEDPLEAIHQAPPSAAPAEAGAANGEQGPRERTRQAISEISAAIRSHRSRFEAEMGLKGGVICMPVLLSGKPYADDSEQRKRISLAVLAALHARGYGLGFPERMTYLEIPIQVTVGGARTKDPLTLRVPVKLVVRDPVSDPHEEEHGPAQERRPLAAVLLLWINEDQLGEQPLSALRQIVTAMFAPRENAEPSGGEAGVGQMGGAETGLVKAADVSLNILGPTSSDMLMKMAREHQARSRKKRPHSLRDFASRGCTATGRRSTPTS